MDAHETLSVIAQRYTARAYTEEKVIPSDLDKIVLAGLQSPSSTNQQKWRIVQVTNQQVINQLELSALKVLSEDAKYQRFYTTIQKRGGKVFYGASTVIVVAVPMDGNANDLQCVFRDAGILVENMALAATALGYGNCICGLAGLPFASTQGDEIRKLLQFPDGYDFGIALLIGKTESEPTPHPTDRDKIIVID